jgi:hypothetical protein
MTGFGACVNAGLEFNFVVLVVPEVMCYTDRVQQSSVPDAIVMELQRGYCSSALFFLSWFSRYGTDQRGVYRSV